MIFPSYLKASLMNSLRSTSSRRHVFFGLLALTFLMENELRAEVVDHESQYRACMSMVHSDPEGAFDAGLSWQGLGGGEAAEHCIASALVKLEQFESAARRLEDLAQNSRRTKEFKAQILSQAASAWSLANDLGRARAVLTSAIKLDETNSQFYVERAQLLAEDNALNDAIIDLNQAININPSDASAFALRGSAYRLLEKFMESQADINQALTLNPSHPEALLERGMLFRIEGKNDEARQDWLSVLELESEGPLAEVARRNLEKMDVSTQ